jgi:hypothetical protein
MIPIAAAKVPGVIDERPHDVKAEPSDGPLYRWLVEIWEGREQRIERFAVVPEVDRQPSDVEGK